MTVHERIIRKANSADSLDIAELWLRSRQASDTIPPVSHTRKEVHAWFSDIVLPSKDVWVTSDGISLTAMMVLDKNWIEQLYVAPEHILKGYGSQLVTLAQEKNSSLALWTFEANISARAFYEAHGFIQSGSPSEDNEEHTPAVCYRWRRKPI